ncbi:MAG: RCC1 domain-containing protein [Acidimicrobiaceae bacterium]|nr:RCC1 domain-containing protein [Acidimicrobiaceae bacterium]
MTDAASKGGQDAPHQVPTPAELEALRTALNPSMPGGGVFAGYNNYWCALTSEGHIHCWGTTDRETRVSELARMPWPSGTFIAIDVGSDFACAIRTDKSLACWGKDHYSDRDLNTPDGEFASVTVGIRDACAIRSDATVVCWQINDLRERLPDNAHAPDGEFVSIAAEGKRICGVKTEGELICWGPIDRDQVRPANGKFISVSGSCAMRADRSLVCWDWSPEHNSWSSVQYAFSSGEFLSFSATEDHRCAVALDGALACWGYERQRRNPEIWFDQYIAVAVTANSACALSVHGRIRCLDIASPAGTRFGPGRMSVQLPGHDAVAGDGDAGAMGARARRIGIGNSFMCMLQDDSTIQCLGWFLQWYHEENEIIGAVPPPGRFVSVVAGPNHACALTTEHTPVCWGPRSQERDPRWGDPVGPGFIPSGTFAMLTAGGSHTCGLRDDRSIECWGSASGSFLGTPEGTYVDVSAGTGYTCALREDGVIVCWSAFGDQETWQHSAPDSRYIRLAAGADQYCGIRGDYLFTCWWGGNSRWRSSGEVHHESTFATFTDVAVGSDHTCGLRLDNTVACWDHYGSEHVGAPGDSFFEIYSGSDTSCATDAQGAITCWGRNSVGQAEAPSGSFADIFSTGAHTCAFRPEGTFEC